MRGPGARSGLTCLPALIDLVNLHSHLVHPRVQAGQPPNPQHVEVAVSHRVRFLRLGAVHDLRQTRCRSPSMEQIGLLAAPVYLH